MSGARRGAVWAALTLTCGLSALAGYAAITEAYASGRASYGAVGVFARALTTIEQRHISGTTAETLLAAAIDGMVDALDPHSAYLPARERMALADATDGRVEGVGVELSRAEGPIQVDRVVRGSPADLAGIQEGDVLLEIDGRVPPDARAASAALAGARGSAVTVQLRRGEGAPLTVPVVRDSFIDVPVRIEREGGVLVVRVDRFTRGIAGAVEQGLTAAQAEGPIAGIILDLRDNPGGLMDEAGRLVDLFCADGLIVETRDRAGTVIDRMEAAAAASDRTEPLVVLVDGGSASAAELTAGALRGLGRATVVGEQTWGKVSVQHLFAFDDGSALKLTVARYHLPGGEVVADREGLRPSPEVPRTRRLRGPLRAALAEARRAAPNDARLADAIAAAAAPDDWEPAPIPRGGSVTDRRRTDPQLEAAWQILAAPR